MIDFISQSQNYFLTEKQTEELLEDDEYFLGPEEDEIDYYKF